MSVTRTDLVAGLRAVGLREGQVALVHSALRTFGPVDGGAETVVDAFLDVLGARGTLVVPTFTFFHEIEDDPLDRSGDGRLRDGRDHRSRPTPARRPPDHGVPAQLRGDRPPGRPARLGGPSAAPVRPALLVRGHARPRHPDRAARCHVHELDEPPLRRVRGRGAVPARAHHARRAAPPARTARSSRRRWAIGSPEPSTDGTYYGSRSTDFNRLGACSSRTGRVGIAPIGNAIVRRFAMRDLIARAEIEAERDYNVFRTAEGEAGNFSSLPDGVLRPQRGPPRWRRTPRAPPLVGRRARGASTAGAPTGRSVAATDPGRHDCACRRPVPDGILRRP